MGNDLVIEKMKNLNLHYVHPSYTLEKKLLSEIKMGLLREAQNTLDQINALEKAKLARDDTRSAKNSLIASCTIFTRAVIDAGINAEDAFDLSDAFIKRIELLDKDSDFLLFESGMVREFTHLVQQTKIHQYPYPISKVVNYIYNHATHKLTVARLAEITHLSANYLSKLFHREVGISLSDFIQKHKIEVAKNFLEHGKMKITDIATLLQFCNHGYFSNVFKKHTGLSPAQYRKLHSV